MAADKTSRVIIISGGSRGLGLGLVRHFLQLGDCVATCSRSCSKEIATLQADPNLAERLVFRSVDIGDADAIRDFVQFVFERLGRIDARLITPEWPTTVFWQPCQKNKSIKCCR